MYKIKVFDKNLESTLLNCFSTLYNNKVELNYSEKRNVRGNLISLVSFLCENNSKRIHSNKLKFVFGKDYSKYIKVLKTCKIIEVESYCNNKFSKLYRLSLVPYFHLIVKQRFSKNEQYIKTLCEKHFQKSIDYDFKHKTKKSSLNTEQEYSDSMSLVKIQYIKLLKQYINNYVYRNTEQKNNFRGVMEKWSSLKRGLTSPITTDHNNRRYSLLTSTPRVLRPFLNIKYSADIHNSHPLLIVKLIEDKLNLSDSTRIQLIKVIRDIELIDIDGFICYKTSNNPSNDSSFKPFKPFFIGKPNKKFMEKHYYTYQYCYGFYAHQISLYKAVETIKRTLDPIAKGEEKEAVESLPLDVWEYIILAFKGKLWDSLVDNPMVKESGMIRQDVKALMFGEVFYSHGISTRGKKWGKLFEGKYPNVYNAIKHLKQEDPSEHLANKMMKLESELFQSILERLYARGFKVVTIHDAIEVIKHKDNKNCTEEVVSKIMREVYNSVGLDPDISIESYSANDVQDMVNDLKILNGYKNKLEVDGNPMGNNDKEAWKKWGLLNSGKYELLLDSNKEPFLHEVLKDKVKKDYIRIFGSDERMSA